MSRANYLRSVAAIGQILTRVIKDYPETEEVHLLVETAANTFLTAEASSRHNQR